jgi:hypothetical protein
MRYHVWCSYWLYGRGYDERTLLGVAMRYNSMGHEGKVRQPLAVHASCGCAHTPSLITRIDSISSSVHCISPELKSPVDVVSCDNRITPVPNVMFTCRRAKATRLRAEIRDPRDGSDSAPRCVPRRKP